MVEPCETRMRFSDGSSAQRLNCAANAGLSLIIISVTGSGMRGSSPAKRIKRKNHPPKPDVVRMFPTNCGSQIDPVGLGSWESEELPEHS